MPAILAIPRRRLAASNHRPYWPPTWRCRRVEKILRQVEEIASDSSVGRRRVVRRQRRGRAHSSRSSNTMRLWSCRSGFAAEEPKEILESSFLSIERRRRVGRRHRAVCHRGRRGRRVAGRRRSARSSPAAVASRRDGRWHGLDGVEEGLSLHEQVAVCCSQGVDHVVCPADGRQRCPLGGGAGVARHLLFLCSAV